MVNDDEPGTVDLSGSDTATAHLHRVLVATAAAFPSVFGEVDVGSSSESFKRAYPDVLPRFEAARADAEERSDIAATMVDAGRAAVVWSAGTGERPLAEHVGAPAEPLELESVQLSGSGRLHPRVPIDGVNLEGGDLLVGIEGIVARGSASESVVDGIEWIVGRSEPDGIDLRDQRIVILGAAAELAPTRLWLEGGADVLWIDLSVPPPELLGSERLSGSLHWVPGGADLLTDPQRIRATIEAFAGDDAVDVGLYGYAPGRAREWRVTTSMNAIVDALPPGIVRSVAMLVSPTTCGVLTPSDRDAEARRRRERPRWQAVLDRVGLLGKGPGHARHGDTCTNRGIVPIQGGSYQTAQYLGKLMAAETWATGDPALRVSANTAGISLTESLHHPVFDTAFSGAAALGVETFDPRTTAQLNGLLTLRDRLDPAASSSLQAGEAQRAWVNDLFSTRVHGGIYELPYPIEPALRVATALGVAKDPRRVSYLLRRP